MATWLQSSTYGEAEDLSEPETGPFRNRKPGMAIALSSGLLRSRGVTETLP